jgi:hypothetical protein
LYGEEVNLLIIISRSTSVSALIGFCGACLRRNQPYSCFVTGDGVHVLRNPNVARMLKESRHAVVCEYSWSRLFPHEAPPIEEGSQTDHSAMIGEADQVLSL